MSLNKLCKLTVSETWRWDFLSTYTRFLSTRKQTAGM